MLRIGIVAGEASGDLLAADLIDSLKDKFTDLIFEGIGGPRMEAAGCRIIHRYEKLAVLGLFEVAGRYFELLSLRNKLIKYFLTNPPDIFIGVDAPDFNLGLEKVLHNNGIKTVHYVSPSVWAWRSYRVNSIKKSTDLMLVLFPFELDIYEKNGISAKYVGHPLADSVKIQPDKTLLKKHLGLPLEYKIVALMPGSRQSELDNMLPLQLETANICHLKQNNLFFITSVLTKEDAAKVENKIQEKLVINPGIRFKVFINQTAEVLSVADVGLLTSGTITLEAMLYGLPMAVVYKINWLSAIIIRLLVKVQFAALPNLLAGKQIVREFLQNDCKPAKMAIELLRLLDPNEKNLQIQEFNQIRLSLKKSAGNQSADAIFSHFGLL
jgi:lipid-A-disaccharide synthase